MVRSSDYSGRIARKNDAAQREKARCPGALAVFRYTPDLSMTFMSMCMADMIADEALGANESLGITNGKV